MSPAIKQLLTRRLLKGYAGEGNISKIQRAFFEGKASNYPTEDGIYHDEWFTPQFRGGGQELALSGNEAVTRLYGGGTPDLEILQFLGISAKDVSSYLKRKIIGLGEQTRFFENCSPKPDGDWLYEYKILGKDADIPVFIGSESIFYRGQRVH